MNISVYAIPGIMRMDNMEGIFYRVCSVFQMDPEEVLKQNKKQKRELVTIRQLSMVLFVFKIGGRGICNSAADFFDKDHSTVNHSIKVIRNLRETDKVFKAKTDPLFK